VRNIYFLFDFIMGGLLSFPLSFLVNIGVETTYYDPTIGKNIDTLIKDNTRLIFLESPGSITMEV
jgi:cystathionine beta-lyase